PLTAQAWSFSKYPGCHRGHFEETPSRPPAASRPYQFSTSGKSLCLCRVTSSRRARPAGDRSRPRGVSPARRRSSGRRRGRSTTAGAERRPRGPRGRPSAAPATFLHARFHARLAPGQQREDLAVARARCEVDQPGLPACPLPRRQIGTGPPVQQEADNPVAAGICSPVDCVHPVLVWRVQRDSEVVQQEGRRLAVPSAAGPVDRLRRRGGGAGARRSELAVPEQERQDLQVPLRG
ncbi:unnamed protein product, partial [Prorocentrum cordatum]